MILYEATVGHTGSVCLGGGFPYRCIGKGSNGRKLVGEGEIGTRVLSFSWSVDCVPLSIPFEPVVGAILILTMYMTLGVFVYDDFLVTSRSLKRRCPDGALISTWQDDILVGFFEWGINLPLGHKSPPVILRSPYFIKYKCRIVSCTQIAGGEEARSSQDGNVSHRITCIKMVSSLWIASFFLSTRLYVCLSIQMVSNNVRILAAHDEFFDVFALRSRTSGRNW